MAVKLTDNITSLYFQAANGLQSKKARKKIVAYVESYDDVSFWNHVLDKFENEHYFFQVMLPSSDSLSKGKKVAMMQRLGQGLGQNMIACVDSDYDYLLQGVTETSRQLIGSPYILHTYAYAIENYQCYAGSMHEVVVKSTLNDHQVLNYEAFFQVYSQVIFPLFVWNIWFYRHKQLGAFSINQFNNVVRLDPVSIGMPQVALQQLDIRVKKKINWLAKRYPKAANEQEALAKELKKLGVDEKETYLFIQGHQLKEQVVMKLLNPVCRRLRRERETEIQALALHETQYQNELTAYHHSQQKVENTLKQNTDFEGASTYPRIVKDIERLLAECDKNLSVTAAEPAKTSKAEPVASADPEPSKDE